MSQYGRVELDYEFEDILNEKSVQIYMYMYMSLNRYYIVYSHVQVV